MQTEPAQTLGYMLAGYGIIFSVMIIYLISLVVRWRNLRKDEEMLEQIGETETSDDQRVMGKSPAANPRG